MLSKFKKLFSRSQNYDNGYPPFKMYYPSVQAMDADQTKYYEFWKKHWVSNDPKPANLSYIYTYIYEVVKKAIADKTGLLDSVTNLKSISKYYPEVRVNIAIWVADLYEYFGFYDNALSALSNEDCYDAQRILNLKSFLKLPMNGKDFVYLAKSFSLRPSTVTKANIEKLYIEANELLNKFELGNSGDFLQYIYSSITNKTKQPNYLFSGIINSHIESKVPIVPFSEIEFVLEFISSNFIQLDFKIKSQYSKRKAPQKKLNLPTQLSHRIWEAKIKTPFKNPNPLKITSDCAHTYFSLVNHWDPFRKYECVDCESIFMCESDKELATAKASHQIQGTWLIGICPSCRGLDDTSITTSGRLMYGSTFYAMHWREIYFEWTKRARNSNESLDNPSDEEPSERPENIVRARYGVPLIGEGWISETTLFKNLKVLFPNNKVIHQGKEPWLGRMRLDVYIPELKIAFEYQGKQHFEPVGFFGGEESFKSSQERDKLKAKLSVENGVKLFYINHGEDFSENTLRKMLKECHVLPNKKRL